MNGRWLMPVPALALAFAVAACGPDVGAAPPTPLGEIPDTALLGAEAVRIAGIRVEPVVASTWSDEWSVPARLVLDPAVTQPLGAIVEGRVMQVLVHPGDRVQAGQVLVTIHSHEMLDARAAHAAATAALVRMESDARLAESAAARAERLYAGKALSVAELERARAAAVDAEALLVDPLTGELVIIDKNLLGWPSIYLKDSFSSGQLSFRGQMTPERVGHALQYVTAADLSADGRFIGVRTYTDAFLFERSPDQSLVEALLQPGCRIPTADEIQGEALALIQVGTGHIPSFVTISEGDQPNIFSSLPDSGGDAELAAAPLDALSPAPPSGH